MSQKLKNRKILLYVTDLKVGNGIAIFLMNYFQSLVEQQAIVYLLVHSVDDSINYQKIANMGISLKRLPVDTSKPCKENIRFIDELLDEGFDIIHANSSGFYSSVLLHKAKKRNICVRIYHAHNPREPRSLKVMFRDILYVDSSIKNANFYVACSETAGKSVFRNKNYTVLCNSMNLDKYAYNSKVREIIRAELDIQDRIVVGVVGRMEEQKNPFKALEIFEQFYRLHPDAVLLWIGNGSLKSRLEEWTKQHQLQEAVLFLGVRMDVNSLYSAMDMFLLPSLYEGLGLVFVEAQCSGLLCFGSDRVPHDVAITDRMNFCSLTISSNEWAKIINNKMEDTKCSSGTARENYLNVVKRTAFNIEINSEALVKLYQESLQ